MKKRIISLMIVIVLAVSLLSVSALAADSEWIEVPGIEGGAILFNSKTGVIEECATTVTQARIPKSIGDMEVKGLGDSAFSGCTSLTSVTIPTGVTNIGNNTFNACTSLISITIPTSVTSIGSNAFNACTSLPSIVIPEGVASISSGMFKDCTKLNSITLPNSVTGIGDSAFEGCTSLTSITLSSSITRIGTDAFRDCTSLENITLPSGVTYIGGSAFNGCASLTSITIPNGITVISDSTFDGCVALSSATLPSTVREIGWAAFENCASLSSITLPNSVTSIDISAFGGCTSLTSITIPDGVTSIESYVFSGCTSLASVTFPNNVTSVGVSAFYNCSSLTNISVPNSVTSIGDSAFSGCTSLKSVVLPSGLTTIERSAFGDCTSLSEINLPNSLNTIGQSAFNGCSSLTSIVIPTSVTSIGDSAFSGCTSLISVALPSSVSSIGAHAFFENSNLSDLYFAGSEDQWTELTSGNSIGIDTKKTRVHCYATGPDNPGVILLNEYTVEVMSYGGGTVTGGGTFKEGTSVTVTATPDEGYAFQYWKKEGTVYSEEKSYTFTVTSDIQLDAFFDVVCNIVTLDTNGGNTMSNIAVPSGQTLALGTYLPTKDGYTFEGWYSDGALTNKVTSVTPTSDITVYAKWIKNPVVTFQTNGGNAVNALSVAAGTVVNLNQYIPTRDGYAFSGWYSDQALTTTVTTVTVNTDMTVYAKWTAEGYTLTFETNGGSTINALTAAPGTVVSLGQYIPVKEGYAFGGWYADQALTTAVSSVTVSADTTVYAKWDAAKYTLSFETNGGSTINSLPASSEVTVSLTQYIPTKAGYQFGGWYSDKELTQPVSEIKLTGDITIYAKWTEQPVVSVLPFTDVKENDWFYGDVKYVYENNLMNGVGDGLFGPGGTTTRGMIVTILYRLEGEPAAALSRFQDVASNMYYAKAVGWAASNGVVNGTSATTFAPNAPITREQMAAILYRYAQYKGYGVTEQVDLSRFTDAGNISAYAVNAIAWANAKGLINGVGEAQLNPTGQASRSQVAAILHRFCTLIAQ